VGSDRWMLVGAYVGFATVGVFCAWYMFDSFLGIDLSGDGHTTVTWHQLRNWESCHTWSDFKVPLTASLRHVSPSRSRPLCHDTRPTVHPSAKEGRRCLVCCICI
jgi:hypothetical protein